MTALALHGCSTPPRGDLGYSRNSPLNTITWTEIRRFSFDDPSVLAAAKITNGKWAVANGKLEATEGEERSILLMPSALDPLRIEFDATCQPNPDGRVGDISVLAHILPDKRYWSDGYLFTTASFYNECSSFYRVDSRFAHTEFSPVVPGQTHHLIMEMAAGHIRYWLDGRVVLEGRDPAPLPRDSSRWFGFRTYNTRLQLDNVVVSTGTFPKTP